MISFTGELAEERVDDFNGSIVAAVLEVFRAEDRAIILVGIGQKVGVEPVQLVGAQMACCHPQGFPVRVENGKLQQQLMHLAHGFGLFQQPRYLRMARAGA